MLCVAVISVVFFILLAIGARNMAAEIIAACGVAVMAAYGTRTLLGGVLVYEDGIRVRGLLLTRALSWEEIERFSFGPLGLFPAVGIAHRTHGRPVALSPIAVARFSTAKARENSSQLIQELNCLLAEHRVGTTNPTGNQSFGPQVDPD